jgi:hypothetical protein
MEPVQVKVNLLDDDVRTLEELARRKGVTQTDVLRQAIALLKFVEDAKSRGERLLVQDRERTLRPLETP